MSCYRQNGTPVVDAAPPAGLDCTPVAACPAQPGKNRPVWSLLVLGASAVMNKQKTEDMKLHAAREEVFMLVFLAVKWRCVLQEGAGQATKVQYLLLGGGHSPCYKSENCKNDFDDFKVEVMLLLETGFNTNLVGCCVANMRKEKVTLHIQYKTQTSVRLNIPYKRTLMNDVLASSQYHCQGCLLF